MMRDDRKMDPERYKGEAAFYRNIRYLDSLRKAGTKLATEHRKQ